MAVNQYGNDYKLNEKGVNVVFSRKMKAVLSDIRGKEIGDFDGQWYVTEVLRTNARQRFLYSKGRAVSTLKSRGFTTKEIQDYRNQGSSSTEPRVTNTLSSMHIKGIACDIVPIKNGAIWWNAPSEVWAIIGKAASAHGLEWGGNWKSFVDRPHVQLPSS